MVSDQRGFGLVSALIAVAILSVATLGFMHLSQMQSGVSQKSNQDFTIFSTLEEMKTLLANLGACEKSVVGYSLQEKKPLTLVNQFSQKRFGVEDKLPNGVEIKSMIITSKNPTGSFRGPMDIEIMFTRGGKSEARKNLRIMGNVENFVIKDCISYEVEAIEASVHKSCENTGGQKSESGECQYVKYLLDGPFKAALANTIRELRCKELGGEYNQPTQSCLDAKARCRVNTLRSISGTCQTGEMISAATCLNVNFDSKQVGLVDVEISDNTAKCPYVGAGENYISITCCKI